MTATPAWPPRSLPRLHVRSLLEPSASVELDSGQANYLGNVLRMAAGDQMLLFDGRSGEWLGEVSAVARKRMTLRILRQTKPQEAVPDLWLAFAPVKKGRVDWLVEKAVELGVARLIPVITQRTIVDKLNLARMEAHIIEAAEQCGRTAIAAISQPVKLTTFLADREADRLLYFANEQGGESVQRSLRPGPATILIGPEGGFTADEADAISASPNVIAIGLGPRILRAETAALAAVTAWMAAAGDWQ
ncbi:16S rRNA (uracil(1498)-N(3))-methyltransferase [Sphingomonas xanthus]|uniref:Ribosomal RNA small subunit methyltransferase E n=1 Tax=Sphingomonas xanthus TaxID=2594473 RepID=A0A516IQN1_9SPHN|nr:16S rRNA (uracil(1498)-N(3))-methyltransferase [Sphingomonas xanthus]QDP19207.1 16S rRNA (uracil(1498)-N(3))-methyltransferase [Sphingomonas xanthus]